MNEPICEKLILAEWARQDGEQTEISAAVINSHLEICEDCRREFEQMNAMHNLLQTQIRFEQPANLWSKIERRIDVQNLSPVNPQPFFVLGALLAAYKIFEILPAGNFELLFSLVPLVLVVALFIFIKENPFKINAQLAPEK